MEIRDFLTSIWGEQEGYIVVGLMNKPGPRGELTRSWDFYYPTQIEDIVSFFGNHQNEDSYFSPLIYGDMRDPKTKRLRRIPENALTSQVIYQDSDTCPPEAFKVRPSIHVETSSGRYQDYWCLHEPLTAEEAALASRKIAVAHREDGSDPSSWSANKFLRVPGSTNTRHGFPEPVTAEWFDDIYDISDINAEYGDVEVNVYRPIARLIDHYVDTDVDLPDYGAAIDKIPFEEFERLGIENLVTSQPPEGKRSEMRYRLLCQLFRVRPELEFEDILAIAWHAPASNKWREDSRNVRGLIMEASKAQTEVGYETGVGVSAPIEGELVVPVERIERPPVSLLSDDERARVSNQMNFVRKYEIWSQSKLGDAHNAPYARMNAWTALSCAFADAGVIPSTGDSLNMFGMGIGDSGSGKSSSRRLLNHLLKEIFESEGGEGWRIGTNASPEALHEVLLERDGKVSVFLGDEAHGWFKRVNGNQWADGIYENIAEYYDGDVPPMHRTTKRDLSGKTARCFFLVHLMGTMKGEMSITNVLTRAMFFSGFLPRFTWYLSDERVVTRESLSESNGDGEFISQGFEPMARQWAAEFHNTKKQLRTKHKRKVIPMNMTQEALDRLTLMKWHARELSQKRNEWELLEPCLIRLGPNVRRAASLLAIEAGRETVTLDDLLFAIGQAEEWLQNMFIMTERVSDSQWKRDTDEIASFIAAKSGKVLFETVMRKFASRRTRDLEEQLNSLKAQGRIAEEAKNGKKYLKVNTQASEG